MTKCTKTTGNSLKLIYITALSKGDDLEDKKISTYIQAVLDNMPKDWLNLTTHRLDIYDEKLAKTQFLEQLDKLYQKNIYDTVALKELPTAYDYIRLGHPLSCLLEWGIAKLNGLNPRNVISFSSKTIPVMAILRKNYLAHKKTRIIYGSALPPFFDAEILRNVYGYDFELIQLDSLEGLPPYEGSSIFVASQEDLANIELNPYVDFLIITKAQQGSIVLVNGAQNENYIADIQHVRRRETISMTPVDCVSVLKALIEQPSDDSSIAVIETTRAQVTTSIKDITQTSTEPLVASSGLSIQYAILMGLIHDALENQKGKAVKIIVPPNCYGGTNDQARRVAACIANAEVVDLPVDGENDMVQSIAVVLANIAEEDEVPLIIAEIPTNPRVEVPNLMQLKEVLSRERKTSTGEVAVDPVFILDQTFCPNVYFLGEGATLSTIRAISFASGSKFPSGGLCTAGYCVGNMKSEALMEKIALHLRLCDNEATAFQMEILAKQLPSMKQRISDAYSNTREFVDYIKDTLPAAKINFVSETLAARGFTPSVFSLDLPTKGDTPEEKEAYKRALNLQLINLMITRIPTESKYCVSYGQLKGCYWTIPATSTQGTTKEGDKDYIARVALSPDMDLELHKKVFLEFVSQL